MKTLATHASLSAALTLLLLSACGGSGGGDSDTASSAPPTAHSSHGLMQLTINGLGSAVIQAQAGSVHAGPQANVAGLGNDAGVLSGLDLQQVSASTVDVGTRGAGGMRYINVVFQVRNAQSCGTPGTCTPYTTASQNLSFVAANVATSLGGTAVTAIYREDGSTDATEQALATQMLPIDGMKSSNPAGGVVLAAGQESLQVFNESEIVGAFVDPDANYLFPYGYVVENINTPGSRSLPANPANNQWDGQLTFAFKVPLQASPRDDAYSVSFIFDVLDDSNTRVTESAEEQSVDGDVLFNQFATTLGSTDLAVLGGRIAQTNIGDPICTVRTAGPAGAATAYLVNNGSGPTVASAPANLVLAPASTLNFGFCTPMDATTATPTTVVLSGSESGLHSGSVTAGGNVLSFAPDHAFTPGEQVSYTLTTGVHASGGAPLPQALVGGYSVGGLTPSGGTFAQGTPLSLPSGFDPYSVATADFNGDGKLDFVVCDLDHAAMIVYLGHGDGTFGAGINVSVNFEAAIPVVGDFNGDGKLDLVVSGAFLPGNGDGTFGAALPIDFRGSNWVATGDFNGDGRLDLASTDANFVYISLGNGDGTFTAPVAINAPGIHVSNFASGDFNGDGKLDLAVADDSSSMLWIFLGQGDGTFSVSPLSYAVDDSPYTTVVGDFNGDGKLDVAISNISFSDGTVSVLLGKGDGTFTAAAIYHGGGTTYYGALVAADFNGDGRQDLILSSGASGNAAVLLGNSDGSFSQANYPTGGSGGFSVAAGDFNGDGKLDLVAPNFSNIAIMLGQ